MVVSGETAVPADSDGLGYILGGVSGGAGGGGSIGAGDSIAETSYGGRGGGTTAYFGADCGGAGGIGDLTQPGTAGGNAPCPGGGGGGGGEARVTLAAPTEGLAITVEGVVVVPSKAGMAESADLAVVEARAGLASLAGRMEDKAGSAAEVARLMMGT